MLHCVCLKKKSCFVSLALFMVDLGVITNLWQNSLERAYIKRFGAVCDKHTIDAILWPSYVIITADRHFIWDRRQHNTHVWRVHVNAQCSCWARPIYVTNFRRFECCFFFCSSFALIWSNNNKKMQNIEENEWNEETARERESGSMVWIDRIITFELVAPVLVLVFNSNNMYIKKTAQCDRVVETHALSLRQFCFARIYLLVNVLSYPRTSSILFSFSSSYICVLCCLGVLQKHELFFLLFFYSYFLNWA